MDAQDPPGATPGASRPDPGPAARWYGDGEASRELDTRHERQLLHVLPVLGPLFSLAVLLFSAWDFWCDASNAPTVLGLRCLLVAIGALGYLPCSSRFAPHLRAGFVYATHAGAMIIAESMLDGGFRYGLASLTSCQFLVAVIAIRPQRFLATSAVPALLLLVLTILELPLPLMLNQLMLFGFAIALSFALMLVIRSFALQTLALEAQLLHSARRDSLTGACNRGYLFELAEREVALAQRHQRPLAIAMLDIDFFKCVNDTHGHAVGDEILVWLAHTCQSELRAIDHFGRIGGEEFVCVMPETSEAEALQCAERLRARIAQATVATAAGPLQCTVSIGVAMLRPPAGEWKALLRAADGALYQAKEAGRNRAVLAG